MTARRKHISKRTRLQMASDQRYQCGCGEPGCWLEVTGGWENEHGLALALGGTDTPENRSLWNRTCHRGKGGKTSRDIKMIRKADRQRRYHETGRSRARKGPPMKSRPFREWRRFDGSIVRRKQAEAAE
ncbi:MAG: hypothetical protein ACTS10_21920 [Kiloniellales bacterium]